MSDILATVPPLAPAVVVTGGSRGIGLALAKRFAAGRRSVAIVARDGEQLALAARAIETIDQTKVVAITCDITRPDAYETIAAEAASAGFYVDVLVNCAGVGLAGPFVDHDSSELERVVMLNVMATTLLMRCALKDMLPRGRGGILNVSSLGAYVPGPNQAAYYASKSYVQSLTEAVASETWGRGIRVSVVLPGPVDTGFHADMGADKSLYRYLLPSMSAERVANIAYRNFAIGSRVIVPGIFNKLMFLALRLLPHPLVVPIVGLLLRRPAVKRG